MNLVLPIKEISISNIFFNESVKNTVVDDSNFIRIIYSNQDFVLNSLYIKIDIYSNKKSNNPSIRNTELYIINLVNLIDKLEQDILNKYSINKQQNNKLKEQLQYYIQKLNSNCSENMISYLLKISGIWETNNIIGLTYKFIYNNSGE